jgi:adenylate cyclase
LGYEYLGEQTVKNIEKPVRVYRVLMEPEAAGKVIGEKRKEKRRAILAAVIVLLIVVGGLTGWYLYIEQSKQVEPASMEKMAYPLPDKPSIAVLPFDNLSGDKSQEYIADGLSENIISSLSKIPDMFVIARNSTFIYKGKPVKVNQVAEELGVRYVLEGSIQKSGKKMRVTAQLVDAIKGHHLWSESYDREAKDFFAVQDDITLKIVVALQVELTMGEQARIQRTTENLEAWGYEVKGTSLFQRYTKEKNAKARELFKKATNLDPNYAFAWVMLAWTHLLDFRYGWSDSRAESLRRGIEILKKAPVSDDSLPEVHSFWNTVYLFQKQYDKAISEGKQAIALGLSDAISHILLSMALHFAGNFEESIFHANKAMRLSPYSPNWYLKYLAQSYCMAGEYEKAIVALEKVIERAKDEGGQLVPPHIYLVHTLVELSQIEDAKDQAAEVLKLDPNFSLENWQKSLFYKDPEDLDRHLNALRRVGLPE